MGHFGGELIGFWIEFVPWFFFFLFCYSLGFGGGDLGRLMEIWLGFLFFLWWEVVEVEMREGVYVLFADLWRNSDKVQ